MGQQLPYKFIQREAVVPYGMNVSVYISSKTQIGVEWRTASKILWSDHHKPGQQREMLKFEGTVVVLKRKGKDIRRE